MKSLRLLVWLRWTLYLRASSIGSRWVGALTSAVLLLALSPLWAGGAIAAYAGVRKSGAPIIGITFALAQIVWIWLGLVMGALGRAFDLDRLLRYPVRPATVYGINVVATVLEPVGLMTLPALGAIALATGQRAGLGAGLLAALAGVLLTLITSALLQLLLALLDDLLRREWMRYLAAFAIPLTFLVLQMTLRHLGRDVATGLVRGHLTAEQAIDMAMQWLGRIPTAMLPALLARGALTHDPLPILGGLAGSVALLALLVAPGARLMRRTAKSGDDSGTRRERKHAAASRGSFAFPLLPMPRSLALLWTREVRYTLGHPQRLMSLIITPVIIILFYVVNDRAAAARPMVFLLMMSSSIGSTAMTMFSYDGPGIRSLYLLPCSPREVVLAKNLEFLAKVVLELLIVIGALTLLNTGIWHGSNLIVLVGAFAVIITTAAIGTMVSIRWPARARRRGIGQRTAGWGGFFALIAVFGTGAFVGLLVWASERVAGVALASLVGFAVGFACLVLGALIWWRSLDRNAALFVSQREKLIEVLAKVEDV